MGLRLYSSTELMWPGCVGRDWWQSLHEPCTGAPMGHILDASPCQTREKLQRVTGEAFVLWAMAEGRGGSPSGFAGWARESREEWTGRALALGRQAG